MGKSDHFAVWGCDNDCKYPEKYAVNDHIAEFDGSLSMRFWFCKSQYGREWSTEKSSVKGRWDDLRKVYKMIHFHDMGAE